MKITEKEIKQKTRESLDQNGLNILLTSLDEETDWEFPTFEIDLRQVELVAGAEENWEMAIVARNFRLKNSLDSISNGFDRVEVTLHFAGFDDELDEGVPSFAWFLEKQSFFKEDTTSESDFSLNFFRQFSSLGSEYALELKKIKSKLGLDIDSPILQEHYSLASSMALHYLENHYDRYGEVSIQHYLVEKAESILAEMNEEIHALN